MEETGNEKTDRRAGVFDDDGVDCCRDANAAHNFRAATTTAMSPESKRHHRHDNRPQSRRYFHLAGSAEEQARNSCGTTAHRLARASFSRSRSSQSALPILSDGLAWLRIQYL